MGLIEKLSRMRRRKELVVIASNYFGYDLISNIGISNQQLREIDSIIQEEYEIEENIKEKLYVISVRISNAFTENGYHGSIYVRTQKILTESGTKLLITVTDSQYDPIFEL